MPVMPTQKYSIDAERGILGAMFLQSSAVAFAFDLVPQEAFHLTEHQRIFSAMLSVFRKSTSIDLISVADELTSLGQLIEVGGDSYLTGILTGIATAGNIRLHARIVNKMYHLRRIARWHLENAELIASVDNPNDIVKALELSVAALSDTTIQQKDPNPSAIDGEIRRRWVKMKSGKIKLIQADMGLFTGNISPNGYVPKLIPSYAPETLIAIGAPASNGKSTLMAEMSKGVGRAGGSQLCFSGEDTRSGKLFQLAGNIASIPRNVLVAGDLSPYQQNDFDKAIAEIKSWPIKFYDSIRTIEGIRLKIIQEKMRGDVDVVFLDYVQTLHGDPNIYKRMSHAANMMDEIKNELGVCFIFFSQIDNQTQRDGGAFVPLKGAGELTERADTVIIMRKENQTKPGHERDLAACFSKNRRGPCQTLEWQFTRNWTGIEARKLED